MHRHPPVQRLQARRMIQGKGWQAPRAKTHRAGWVGGNCEPLRGSRWRPSAPYQRVSAAAVQRQGHAEEGCLPYAAHADGYNSTTHSKVRSTVRLGPPWWTRTLSQPRGSRETRSGGPTHRVADFGMARGSIRVLPGTETRPPCEMLAQSGRCPAYRCLTPQNPAQSSINGRRTSRRSVCWM